LSIVEVKKMAAQRLFLLPQQSTIGAQQSSIDLSDCEADEAGIHRGEAEAAERSGGLRPVRVWL
jgi:hypothetical protein